MNRFKRFLTRISAFLTKEIIEILRQPRLVLTLIIGPFLILFIFGIGYRDEPRIPRTLFVIPPESRIRGEVDQYATSLVGIDFAGTTDSADEADNQLRRREVDLVVAVPVDPAADVRENRQARLRFFHNEIDPFEVTFVTVLERAFINALNDQVLLEVVEGMKAEMSGHEARVSAAQENAAAVRRLLEAGQSEGLAERREALRADVDALTLALGAGGALYAGLGGMEDGQAAGTNPAPLLTGLQSRLNEMEETGVGGGPAERAREREIEEMREVEADLATLETWMEEFQAVDSLVLVKPFAGETASVTAAKIEATDFFVPAVIALLLQHMAVTLAALSLVRERTRGSLELFRATPISAFETLVGKYVSYTLFVTVLAAVLSALVFLVLGVPMLGGWGGYAVVLLALVFTSLGAGFAISAVSRTESQAVQYAMILLLASIFFSGFFIALYRLWAPVRVVSWLLPATYGTSLLQDIMLRGNPVGIATLLALLALGLALFLFTWFRLGRQMAQE